MKRKMTIQEIARLAGVSKATVSRVLNNRGGVSPETRRKVEEVIRLHSYTPNLVARGLSLKKTGSIGLIVAHTAERLSSHLFFIEFLRGISAVLDKRGFRLILAPAESEDRYETSCRTMAEGGVVDGVVVLGVRRNDKRLRYFLRAGIPVVTVGRPIGFPKVDYVDADNTGGARVATEYLLRLGHGEVLFINGPRDHTASLAREKGYRQAFKAMGRELDEDLIVYGDFSFESGYETVRGFLARGKSLSAVFAASDLAAMGAITAFKEAGIRVGHEVSVIGFDDIPYAHFFDPPLTTVRQPIYEMGKEAGRILLLRLEGEAGPGRLHKTFPTQLIVRESTIRS